MVTPTREIVYLAVDLSRLDKNPVAETQIGHLLMVGREVDLLETIRRTEKQEKVTLELVRFQAAVLGMDIGLLDAKVMPIFQEMKMLRVVDEKIILDYTTTEQIYEYGLERIRQVANESELRFLNVLVGAMKRPVPLSDLEEVIDLFPTQYREALKRFILENNILASFCRKKESYVVSPRIYKNPDKFLAALEILGDHRLDSVTTFISDNPGNPLPVVSKKTAVDLSTIAMMGRSGIVDPIRLEVQGDTKDYLYLANVLSSKGGSPDHFDLVKMTLANFRFGEYYSKKTRLYNLDRFLEYMLEHGYAGWAEPIGTDYKNLETKGIFKIVPVSPNKYRFWMLKRDVVEDARSVLRGVIPFQSELAVGDLNKIDNLVQSRRRIEVSPVMRDAIVKALRDIQDGMLGK